MNIDELIKYFDDNKAPTIGEVSTKTLVKMNKKDVATKSIPNTLGEVYKTQKFQVLLNANYESMVNSGRAAEDKPQDFVAQERKWGTKINGTIIQNGDEYYLSVIEQNKLSGASYETADGVTIEYAEFEKFVPIKAASVSQGLASEVKIRSYKLSSVNSLSIDGVEVFNQ